MDSKSPNRLTLIAYFIVAIFGGVNAVAIRLSNPELAPFWGATLRFGMASLIFMLIALLFKTPLPQGKAFAGSVVFGLLNFGISYASTYWALQYVSAGLAQVMMATGPLFTLFLVAFHGMEPLRLRSIVGALLSLAGIAVVFWDPSSSALTLMPFLALMLSTFSASESGVILKRFPKSYPITTNLIAMSTGTIFLFVMSLLWNEPRSLPTQPVTWLALLYLATIGSVLLFILVLYIIENWTVSATSYLFVIFPFVSLTAGALLAGETVTPAILLGGALVVLGVYIGALMKPLRKPTPEIRPAD